MLNRIADRRRRRLPGLLIHPERRLSGGTHQTLCIHAAEEVSFLALPVQEGTQASLPSGSSCCCFTHSSFIETAALFVRAPPLLSETGTQSPDLLVRSYLAEQNIGRSRGFL